MHCRLILGENLYLATRSDREVEGVCRRFVVCHRSAREEVPGCHVYRPGRIDLLEVLGRHACHDVCRRSDEEVGLCAHHDASWSKVYFLQTRISQYTSFIPTESAEVIFDMDICTRERRDLNINNVSTYRLFMHVIICIGCISPIFVFDESKTTIVGTWIRAR